MDGRGRVRMLRSLARRRQKMHGVWKFNNITPSQLETHPVAKLSQLETSWGNIVDEEGPSPEGITDGSALIHRPSSR
jgi:hypothetical protein